MAEFVEILSPSALKDLEKANAELLTMVANVNKVGAATKNISTPSGSDSAVKELTKQYEQQEKVIKSLQTQLTKLSEKQTQHNNTTNKSVQSILNQSKSYQDLEKQRNKAIAQMDREQAKLAAAQNIYNKTQQQLNIVQAAYNNLAAKKERYNNLTAQEEARLNTLRAVTEKYNTTLRAVDATVGKHTRNVGNYASAFNPLSNSINQIGREMPAFANSVQTGFMAISNNLPIFFDAMQNVIAQNKQLQAEGKPTQSVLSQIAGSLFSFQTLLTVGVTLLTVYGKEIVNWAASLFGASEALDELNKNQKEFNKSRVEGRKNAQDDIIELRKYLSVAKDVNANEDFRAEAIKKLRAQYFYYFKDLTDAQIKSGQYGDAVKDLTKALERKGQIELATAANVSNKQRLIDLEQEEKSQKAVVKQLTERAKALFKLNEQGGVDPQILYNATINQTNAEKKLLGVQRDINAFRSGITKNDAIIFDLKQKTIALEIQEDKQREKKIKQVKDLSFEMQDFLANQYELIKQQKELEAQALEGIFKDEGNSLDQRLTAYDAFITKKIELANLELAEQLRLNKKGTEEQKAELNERYNEFIRTEGVTAQQRIDAKKELDSALFSLDKKTALEIELIQLNHGVKVFDIVKDTNDKILKLKRETNTLEVQRDLNEQELKDLEQFNLQLANITTATTKKRLKEVTGFEKSYKQQKQKELLQLELQNLAEDLEATQTTSDEKTKIQTKYFAKRKELLDLENAELKENAENQKRYLQEVSSYMQGFMSEFAADSGFPQLFKILNDQITGF